jgi:hypothetical protein
MEEQIPESPVQKEGKLDENDDSSSDGNDDDD